jgi:hypothetical protein
MFYQTGPTMPGNRPPTRKHVILTGALVAASVVLGWALARLALR